MVANVDRGINGYQRFDVDGEPYLGVGIKVAEFDGVYFEAFPLDTTQRTLQAIATALGDALSSNFDQVSSAVTGAI